MSEIVRRINAILSLGKKFHPDKKTAEMLSQLSRDYSSQDYPKMTPEQFLSSNATKAALSPKDVIEPYYGKAFPQELVAAGNYNIQNRVVKPESYSRVFDTIPAERNPIQQGFGSLTFNRNKGNATVKILNKEDHKESVATSNSLHKWLTDEGPDYREGMLETYQANSFDPSIPPYSEQKSVLEHELGHYITQPSELSAEQGLVEKAWRNARIASDNAKDFGSHTQNPYETTQALARFQREWFKEKGSRITDPNEFVKLVDSGKIPDFLSSEGRRILIYAKNLKNVKDTSKDEKKKKAAEEAIKGLGEMIPAVVQNKKQIGLNLRLG
jgi:hypothetical protein